MHNESIAFADLAPGTPLGPFRVTVSAAANERYWRTVGADHPALRALHDTLPVDDCPFTWSTADRLDRARAAVADADTDAGRRPGGLGPEPPADRTVVCHGDPCTPNTLIGADRRWSAHVDLDAMGLADRWADIAVATMALGWNYGPGWEPLFHRAYGLPDDPERTAWYRALWNIDVDDVGPATS